jgi:hypothetical protein
MSIEITAYFNGTKETAQHARVLFNLTDEEADALPKSLKLKSTNGRNHQTVIKFLKDGVIGEKNETGINRIRKMFELGAVFKSPEITSNAYRSKEEFLAAIDA